MDIEYSLGSHGTLGWVGAAVEFGTYSFRLVRVRVMGRMWPVGQESRFP